MALDREANALSYLRGMLQKYYAGRAQRTGRGCAWWLSRVIRSSCSVQRGFRDECLVRRWGSDEKVGVVCEVGGTAALAPSTADDVVKSSAGAEEIVTAKQL
jgi:hypothetical protein